MNPSVRSSKSPGGSQTRVGSGAKPGGDSSLKYKLSLIPRDEFNQIHMMVRACFDEGRQQFSPELKTVSTNIRDMPVCHYEYLSQCDALGVAMGETGNTNKYHLWINPSYKWPSFKFYMTLAHELTHVYAGLQYGHSAHWRRWFYRVLSHLIASEVIPMPESPISMLLYSVERCYNHSGGDLFSLPVEALAKATDEHKKVLDNYWERLNAPSRNHSR